MSFLVTVATIPPCKSLARILACPRILSFAQPNSNCRCGDGRSRRDRCDTFTTLTSSSSSKLITVLPPWSSLRICSTCQSSTAFPKLRCASIGNLLIYLAQARKISEYLSAISNCAHFAIKLRLAIQNPRAHSSHVATADSRLVIQLSTIPDRLYEKR